MTKNQFTNLIRNCNSDLFTEIAIEKNGVVIPIKKIGVARDDKKIFFHTKENRIATAIEKSNILDIELITVSRDDFDYSLLITTKNDNNIKVHINMEDGYSLYAYTDNVIRNYNAVSKSIPKHLDKYKGKNVTIKHNVNTAMYRTIIDEDDETVLPVTDSYIINDFDYVIFYDAVSPNIPCIKMYSNENKNIYTCAMGVKLITDKVIFTADGDFVIEEV